MVTRLQGRGAVKEIHVFWNEDVVAYPRRGKGSDVGLSKALLPLYCGFWGRFSPLALREWRTIWVQVYRVVGVFFRVSRCLCLFSRRRLFWPLSLCFHVNPRGVILTSILTRILTSSIRSSSRGCVCVKVVNLCGSVSRFNALNKR